MPKSILKDLSYYEQNKRKFNKSYNRYWKKIAGPNYIGLCSYLFQKFYDEWKGMHKDIIPSVHDFAEYYISHINPVKSDSIIRMDSRYYGRSVEELYNLASEYQKMCDDYTIPLESYFDDIVNHAIVETYNGQMREIMLINEYEKKGYTAKHTYGKWDKELGVDFIIKDKNGKICDYVQCKPITTFIKTVNESLIEDRVSFFRKEEDKKNECIRLGWPYYPTKFVMYNTEYPNKWATINGKRGFLLSELIDTDGNNKFDIKDFTYT